MASRVSVDEMSAYVRAVCTAVGMPAADTELLTGSLIEAELRGISSHGCARLPAYARALAARIVNPAPVPKHVRGAGAFEVVDGDNGLGIVLGQRAMNRAVEIARN